MADGSAVVERLCPVRMIIAGTRGDYAPSVFYPTVKNVLRELMTQNNYTRADVEIISGMAASGADFYAVLFAEKFRFTLKEFWPTWEDVDVPGARIKYDGRGRKYNARAGHDRNTQMAKYATHLLAFWDGKSKGTEHMINEARRLGLVVLVVNIATPRTRHIDGQNESAKPSTGFEYA